LLQRVAHGDQAAVRECIHRFGPLVWSIARRLSTSPAEAEDAVQEVFVDLWRSAARYDATVASEVAFVAMIARRRIIDRRRRHERRVPTDFIEDAPTVFQGADDALESCGEALLARRVLEQLKPDQRQVLIMAACHGMSHQEIAALTGMPLGTVKAHARRGLMRVREMLADNPPSSVRHEVTA
jgi:RNA polymerase sigma-70 factor (ECF subfamily)